MAALGHIFTRQQHSGWEHSVLLRQPAHFRCLMFPAGMEHVRRLLGGECQCLALHGAQGLPEASAFHACTASCAGSRKDGSRGSGAPTVGVGDSEVRESRCCVMLPASKGASGTGRSALQGVLPRHECITSCPVVPAAVRGECPPIFSSQRRSLTQKVY